MRLRVARFIFASLFAACMSLNAFAQFASRVNAALSDAQIIVTAAPTYEPLAALHGGERFPQGAQLLLIQAGKAERLVPDFAATADANVSFDASRVLFSGKKSKDDPWQIWEFSLKDHSLRRLIAQPGDAIRPMYLPAGQFVFALHTASGFQLEVAGKTAPSMQAPIPEDAGDAIAPLSYIRASAIPSDVLLDGRDSFRIGIPAWHWIDAGALPRLFRWQRGGVVSLRSRDGALGRQAARLWRCRLFTRPHTCPLYLASCARCARSCSARRLRRLPG